MVVKLRSEPVPRGRQGTGVLVGERIRELRDRNGWTLEQAGGYCGIPLGQMSRFENGTAPGSRTLAKLAVGLRVSADWLLGIEP